MSERLPSGAEALTMEEIQERFPDENPADVIGHGDAELQLTKEQTERIVTIQEGADSRGEGGGQPS